MIKPLQLVSYLFSIYIILYSTPLFAQDTVPHKKELKNIVRFNISNPVILNTKCLVFGYERVVGKHQSFSINFGQISLPQPYAFYKDRNGKRYELKNSSTEMGFHASVDYRFYLKKENKFNAPRGIYIAPYYSFNYFERENTWALTSNGVTGDLSSNFTFNMNTVGGEIGYQFILWNRLAIDLILFGPGASYFNIKTTFNTDLDPGDKAEMLQELGDALRERIPGFDFVFDGAEYETSGTNTTMAMGFRYMLHLGFRF